MIRYETLMLTGTGITDDELSLVRKGFEDICSKAKGTVSRFDKWGKYKLAYPINGNFYGVYTLVRFELPQETLSKALREIEALLKVKFNELVWRHVTVRLKPNAPVDYHRPDPVDVAKSHQGEGFKDDKVNSLLESVGTIDDVDASMFEDKEAAA